MEDAFHLGGELVFTVRKDAPLRMTQAQVLHAVTHTSCIRTDCTLQYALKGNVSTIASTWWLQWMTEQSTVIRTSCLNCLEMTGCRSDACQAQACCFK